MQVEGTERFIEKKKLRLVYDGAGNGDPLLLAAAQGIHAAVFETVQVYELQRVLDLIVNIAL